MKTIRAFYKIVYCENNNNQGVIIIARIEQTGKITFRQAIKDFFRGYVDFKGRTTRAGYWWATLALILIAIVTTILLFFGIFSALTDTGTILWSLPFVIFVLGGIIPSMAMNVRRYRDVGLTGWGTLCLWIVYFLLSQMNYNYGWDSVAEEIVFSTNPMFTFVTAIINIFMLLLTIF
ncbi:MAG: DUF805 domain-containing protein, partial [Enterococcus sp.]|nr:DUF805 domain-containing protein [Enterococcus sp.]